MLSICIKVRIGRCVNLQDRSSHPEKSDASVMVNMVSPDFANAVNTDLSIGPKYSVAAAAALEPPTQSQAGPVYHPRVRHPFPFAAIANQLPAASSFPPPTSVGYRLPTATVAAPVGNVYSQSPFSLPQFSREVLNDRAGPGPPAANSYQTNIDSVHQSPFDNFSSLFRMMPPPVSAAANNPNFYAGSQSLSCSSPASGFMSQPDTGGFDSLMQSSSGRSSSQSWQTPLADVHHRPTFGPLSHFQLPLNESSVGDFSTSLPLQSSAVGSNSLSSGSPITDLLDRGNSPPTQLPGARYGCAAVTLPSPSMSDMMESVHHTVATGSPFRPSPVEGLQLSRSLPAGVRFGCLDAGTAAVGHHYATSSRMHFDSMPPAASPIPRQPLYQPPSLLDDRTTATTAYQVNALTVLFHWKMLF